MAPSLDLPGFSLAVPKLSDVNADNISSMWSVFSKCKDNLENGRRLENLSWRLWYREAQSQRTSSPTPIPIAQSNEYYQPSAGSSMNDSAVSGCGRSAKQAPLFAALDSPATKPTEAIRPTSPEPHSFFAEHSLLANDNNNSDDDDDDTCSEWSAQDDETVFAQDDDGDDWDFRKEVPKCVEKQSLLSIMLQNNEQQRPVRLARRSAHRDLSENLQFCVDWERRQNVSPPIALLRRSPACVATSCATATCTSWFEPFRGW